MEMAAVLVKLWLAVLWLVEKNQKITAQFKPARRKKLKCRISLESKQKHGSYSRFSENMLNMLNIQLAVQWLVEKKSLLNEKEPDSRKLFGRALNAVFSWLVALEIGWFTKKLLEKALIQFEFSLQKLKEPIRLQISHRGFATPSPCQQWMQNLQKTCSVLSFGSLLNDLGPPQRQCRDFSVNGQILSIPALASGKTAAAGLIVGLGISG